MFLITLLKNNALYLWASLIALLVTQNLSVVRLWKKKGACPKRKREGGRKREGRERDWEDFWRGKPSERTYEVILKLGGWLEGIELWLA